MPAAQPWQERTEVRVTIRDEPVDDPWPEYGESRYSSSLRQVAVKAFLPYLKRSHIAWIRKKASFPSGPGLNQRYAAGYVDAYTEVCAHVYATHLFKARSKGKPESEHDDIEQQIWEDVDEVVTEEWARAQEGKPGYPKREAVRRMTHRCILHYCCNGHYLDEKPSHAGDKLAEQSETLKALRDMMVAGWQSKDGRRHMFTSIEDYARRDEHRRTERGQVPGEKLPAQSYADLKSALRVDSDRTVWSKLTAAYPGIRKVKQRVRKVRKNKAEVMVRASRKRLPAALHDLCVFAALVAVEAGHT